MTDDLLPNLTDRRPPRRTWLRENFEDSTFAAMSVAFGIAAVAGFVLVVLAWTAVLALVVGDGELRDTFGGLSLCVELLLWIGFLLWLLISLARIARGWGPERLGTPVFKRLQMGFLIITVLTMLGHGALPKDLEVLVFMLLVFDFIVVGMAVVFLLLVWSARCPVPWRTYREIFVMVAVFVLQVVLIR